MDMELKSVDNLIAQVIHSINKNLEYEEYDIMLFNSRTLMKLLEFRESLHE